MPIIGKRIGYQCLAAGQSYFTHSSAHPSPERQDKRKIIDLLRGAADQGAATLNVSSPRPTSESRYRGLSLWKAT